MGKLRAFVSVPKDLREWQSWQRQAITDETASVDDVTTGDAAVTAAFAAADAAHVAAGDPHTQYRLESANVPWSEVSSKPAWISLIYSGTGSPESVVTAGVGSLYLRTDGGASTTLYVKESGSGSTGWIAK